MAIRDKFNKIRLYLRKSNFESNDYIKFNLIY